MVRIKCPKCKGRKSFVSGPMAKVKSVWNCPKCNGAGWLTINLWDRILLSIAIELRRVLRKYTSFGA